MMDYIRGVDRNEVLLYPECVEDYITEDNPIRFVDAFAESLDLVELGFVRAIPAETGRPAYDWVDEQLLEDMARRVSARQDMIEMAITPRPLHDWIAMRQLGRRGLAFRSTATSRQRNPISSSPGYRQGPPDPQPFRPLWKRAP